MKTSVVTILVLLLLSQNEALKCNCGGRNTCHGSVETCSGSDTFCGYIKFHIDNTYAKRCMSAAECEIMNQPNLITTTTYNLPCRQKIPEPCSSCWILLVDYFLLLVTQHVQNSRLSMAGRPGGNTRPNSGATNKICQFKLVLLGESAVGKSSLVLRFVKGQFHEYQEATIGAAFLTQTVCLDDTTVKFEIWDTAGQERYHSLAPMYYRGAQAAIVVFDITSAESFVRAKTWVMELQRQASPNIVIALAGNKADMVNKRAVEAQEAQEYADDNRLLFMETSAKTAMNVNEIFMAIAKKLPKSDPQAGAGQTGRPRAGVDLQQQAPQSRSCCGGGN
ncbi:hypothetical protein WMY93_010826 [Mugilogobius chulae]|uniref:small monomeric GTPase n=1 Tax=Mugilogobius chulae TaxID=88201 RepID=A0AAW0PBZ6_9GOBI